MPPWLVEFRSALAQNRRQRSVQVATSDPEGGPTVRTVILRRVQEDGALVFFTDTRSEKAAQLERDDRVEVHAWWTKGRVQFRLRGRAQLISDEGDPLRRELWSALSEEDLVRFLGPAPGSLALHRDRLESSTEPATLDATAETFALVRVRPTRVDVLRLDPEGHTRTLHELEGRRWTTVATCP